MKRPPPGRALVGRTGTPRGRATHTYGYKTRDAKFEPEPALSASGTARVRDRTVRRPDDVRPSWRNSRLIRRLRRPDSPGPSLAHRHEAGNPPSHTEVFHVRYSPRLATPTA